MEDYSITNNIVLVLQSLRGAARHLQVSSQALRSSSEAPATIFRCAYPILPSVPISGNPVVGEKAARLLKS